MRNCRELRASDKVRSVLYGPSKRRESANTDPDLARPLSTAMYRGTAVQGYNIEVDRLLERRDHTASWNETCLGG